MTEEEMIFAVRELAMTDNSRNMSDVLVRVADLAEIGRLAVECDKTGRAGTEIAVFEAHWEAMEGLDAAIAAYLTAVALRARQEEVK